MGINKSKPANESINNIFDFYFNSDDKEFLTVYPESQVASQIFSPSLQDIEYFSKKENFILTGKLIADILLNYDILTQEKSQKDAFIKIIIPEFSKLLLADPIFINSRLLLNFHHKTYQYFIAQQEQIINTYYKTENKDNFKAKINLLKYKMEKSKNELKASIYNFFQKNNIKKVKFSYESNSYTINNIQSSIDLKELVSYLYHIGNSTCKRQFLVYSLVISLLSKNLKMLVLVIKQILLLLLKQKKDKFQNITTFELVSNNYFGLSFTISSNLSNGYINYPSYELPKSNRINNLIASTSLYLYAVSENSKLIEIYLGNSHITNMAQRYRVIDMSGLFPKGMSIAISNNLIVVFDESGKIKICGIEPFQMQKDPTMILPKGAPRLQSPVASDGKFLYSLISQDLIAVFEANLEGNSLNYIHSIKLQFPKFKVDDTQDQKCLRLKPFDKVVIPKEFLSNATMITNGIILELFYQENQQSSSSQFEFFVRCFNLVTGNHIYDFRITLPYPICSLCFDPISNHIWSLSPSNHGALFVNFEFIGSYPTWISTLHFNNQNNTTANSSSSYLNYIIDKLHLTFCQFFGVSIHKSTKMREYCKSFFVSENIIDLILGTLQNITNELKKNNQKLFLTNVQIKKSFQILLTFLSFQIKCITIDENQTYKLYEILEFLSYNETFSNFLFSFIIDICPFINANFIHIIFKIVFDFRLNSKNERSNKKFFNQDLMFILYHIGKYTHLPFIINNENFSIFTLLNKYSNSTQKLNNEEFEFLFDYQSSIFHLHIKEIKIKNSKFLPLIEKLLTGYSNKILDLAMQFQLENIVTFIQSQFCILLKNFLILVKHSLTYSEVLTSSLYPRFTEIFYECIKRYSTLRNYSQKYYMFFYDIFFTWLLCTKLVIVFSNSELLQINQYKYFILSNINSKIFPENKILRNKINSDELIIILNTLYSHISHPLNKKLTNEEKEFEKLIFLAVINNSKCDDIYESLIQIKDKQNEINIIPSLRHLIQAIYKIRNNLRSKRQKNTILFSKLKDEIQKKCIFLLKINPKSENKLKIDDIIEFITNENIDLSNITNSNISFQNIKKRIDSFFSIFDSIFSIELPLEFAYILLLNFVDIFKDFYYNDSILQFINFDFGKIFVKALSLINQIPVNVTFSFTSSLLLLFIRINQEDNINHTIIEALSQSFYQLSSVMNSISKVLFKATFVFLCYFSRILTDENLFNPISLHFPPNYFESININFSFSFIIAHSLLHAKLLSSKDLYQDLVQIDPLSFMPLISQPKFHSYSLYLYEWLLLITSEKEFINILSKILMIIGSILSGSSDKHLLACNPPTLQLWKAQKSQFCKTSSSKISVMQELIQVIRRILTNTESIYSKYIVKYFSSLLKNMKKSLDLKTDTKQIFAILGIISDIQFDVIYQNSIATNLNENKSYLVSKFHNFDIIGLLIPIVNSFNQNSEIMYNDFSSCLIMQYIDQNKLKHNDFIQPSSSIFKEIPEELIRCAFSMTTRKYSDCLFCFYAFNYIYGKLNFGGDNCHLISSLIKTIPNTQSFSQIDKIVLDKNASLAISLLKKSLQNESNGIFDEMPIYPKFYHASCTKLIFENDYKILQDKFISIKSVNVFISSILEYEGSVYFSIKLTNNTRARFGVITHSLDKNHSYSLTYSTIDKCFYSNNNIEPFEYSNNAIIECRYSKPKNKISFASSNLQGRQKSIILQDIQKCSFIIIVYPQNSIEYNCSFKPLTDCFQKNPHFNQIKRPGKLIKNIFGLLNPSNQPKIDTASKQFSIMKYDVKFDKDTKIINYSKSFLKSIINHKILLTQQKCIFSENLFPEINANETVTKLLEFYNNLYYDSRYMNIYSTPILLSNYINVNEVTGKIDFVPYHEVEIEPKYSIPVFHFETFFNIPQEVINYYFSGVYNNYLQEFFSLLTIQALSSCGTYKNLDLNIDFYRNLFLNKTLIINIVTSILLILEPINFSKLIENKCPIDFFEFNSFNTCSKPEYYDFYLALNTIISFIKDISPISDNDFVKAWHKKF